MIVSRVLYRTAEAWSSPLKDDSGDASVLGGRHAGEHLAVLVVLHQQCQSGNRAKAEAASAQWRAVADQIRPKVPKLATIKRL